MDSSDPLEIRACLIFFLSLQGDSMKSIIDTFKAALKKKSRENKEMEMKIRAEVSEEMAHQLVKIQEQCDERVVEATVSVRGNGIAAGQDSGAMRREGQQAEATVRALRSEAR
jgi:hypothetical protein